MIKIIFGAWVFVGLHPKKMKRKKKRTIDF